MEPKKLSFGNIKNELSRDELKNIMAGSGGDCVSPKESCYCVGRGNIGCYTPMECLDRCLSTDPDIPIGKCRSASGSCASQCEEWSGIQWVCSSTTCCLA